jgi:hypothetical protein
MEKFGLIKDAADLAEMYKSMKMAENSLIIVIAYDCYTYKSISEELIRFADKKLRTQWKVGGISLSPNSALKMQVVQRDLPGRDLEQLILACQQDSQRESLYDTMINACGFFVEDSTSKSMLVIICELTASGSCSAKDLYLIAERGVTIYIIAKEGILAGDDIMDFVTNAGVKLIEFGSHISFEKALTMFYDYVKD